MTASNGDKTSGLDSIEKLARLRLIRSENVGPITFFKLLERFKTAKDALNALPSLAKNGGREARLKVYPQSKAEDEIANVEKSQVAMVHWGEPMYPRLLVHIDDPPPILFVRGHTSLLTKKAVGFVGSRNASINGRRFAQAIAKAIGEAGYLIVSGMARGIDAAAHEGSLATGTLAILGGGVDVVYPREHRKLYDELLEKGAVCSEVPLGVTPQARHFPRRNRIISGISRGVVVLEAGARSGSLITARMALEQGREVFAVPGSPQDPRVKGTNMLIRQGAQLTENAADVIETLGGMMPCSLAERRQDSLLHQREVPVNDTVNDTDVEHAREQIITLLDYGPTDTDGIIRAGDIHAGTVATVLLELELAGQLERHNGNRVSLISPE
jgi:DNA processing protein